MERLKNITIIFLLAIGLLVPAALAKPASVLLQEGLYAEETEGDLDAAIKVYEQIVKDNAAQRPYVGKAMYRLGMCYLKKGQKQQALETFQKQTSDSDSLAFATDQAKKATGKRKLLVTSNRTGNYEIFLMNEDGSGAKNLTNHDTEDSGPAWSPNGKRIVFSSNRSGNSDIYVMDADGSNVRQLTTDSRKEGWPAWSPDGKTITFTRSMDPSDNLTGDIFTIKPDGTGETNLTDNPAHDGDSAWSPDGKRIVFISSRGVGFRLHVMGSDGKDVQRVLEKQTAYTYPAWSPDGNKLVFGSYAPGGRGIELFLYNFESGKNRQLTTLGALNTYPAWSSDGKTIAFQHHDPFGKPGTLYLMDADGSNLKKILTEETHARYGGGRPAWKPK